MPLSSIVDAVTRTVYNIMLNAIALFLAITIQGLIWAFILLAASQIFPVLQYMLQVMNTIKSFLFGH